VTFFRRNSNERIVIDTNFNIHEREVICSLRTDFFRIAGVEVVRYVKFFESLSSEALL
jgi:hypothetical protein